MIQGCWCSPTTESYVPLGTIVPNKLRRYYALMLSGKFLKTNATGVRGHQPGKHFYMGKYSERDTPNIHSCYL